MTSLKRVDVCPNCAKTMRLNINREFDVGVVIYRAVEDWYFELWLIVDDSPVFPLFGAVHRGFVDELSLAEKQGRLDDLEEKALFEEVERVNEGEGRRSSSER
jgi:hypothetical protein